MRHMQFPYALLFVLVSMLTHSLVAEQSKNETSTQSESLSSENYSSESESIKPKPIRGYWAIMKAKSVLEELALNDATELKFDNAVRAYSQQGKALTELTLKLKAQLAKANDAEEINKLKHELAAANEAIKKNKLTGYANIMKTLNSPQQERMAGMQLYMIAARRYSKFKLSPEKKSELRQLCYTHGKSYLAAKLENSEEAREHVMNTVYVKAEKTILK